MNEAEDIKELLADKYGSKIAITITTSTDTPLQFALKEKARTVDYAVSINKRYGLILIWNIAFRRKNGCEKKVLTYSKCWSHIEITQGRIVSEQKYFTVGSSQKRIIEYVLIMNFDTFYSVEDDLFDILGVRSIEDIEESVERTRSYVGRWNRDQTFRQRILERYANRCAICRCEAEEILEAAHIQGFALTGNNDVENGICLCANHHKMFDRDLIKINFENRELYEVNDIVKKMAWYRVFMEKYNGKILEPITQAR